MVFLFQGVKKQHSLKCYQYGGHFRALYDLYEKGELRKCHYKAAIWERNKWLAENCDMMIVYIKRDYGGAYKCYKYAKELGVPIMNIADNIKNNYGK